MFMNIPLYKSYIILLFDAEQKTTNIISRWSLWATLTVKALLILYSADVEFK